LRATIRSAPAVGHLIGYVGAASAEQYKKTKDPLLVTPGFKLGKDGLERRWRTSCAASPAPSASR
jgi:penicillin-binding protein 2